LGVGVGFLAWLVGVVVMGCVWLCARFRLGGVGERGFGRAC
jgi:hypothetical protein